MTLNSNFHQFSSIDIFCSYIVTWYLNAIHCRRLSQHRYRIKQYDTMIISSYCTYARFGNGVIACNVIGSPGSWMVESAKTKNGSKCARLWGEGSGDKATLYCLPAKCVLKHMLRITVWSALTGILDHTSRAFFPGITHPWQRNCGSVRLPETSSKWPWLWPSYNYIYLIQAYNIRKLKKITNRV